LVKILVRVYLQRHSKNTEFSQPVRNEKETHQADIPGLLE